MNVLRVVLGLMMLGSSLWLISLLTVHFGQMPVIALVVLLALSLLLEFGHLRLDGTKTLGDRTEGGQHPAVGGTATGLGFGRGDEAVVEFADALLLLVELAFVQGFLRGQPLAEGIGRRRSSGQPGSHEGDPDQETDGRTDEEALETLYPYQSAQVTKLRRERGWPPFSREQYLASAAADGALYVGSPETVATKIVRNLRLLGASRFDLRYSMGLLPHEHLMSSIGLYGREVAPMVREMMAEKEPAAAL